MLGYLKPGIFLLRSCNRLSFFYKLKQIDRTSRISQKIDDKLPFQWRHTCRYEGCVVLKLSPDEVSHGEDASHHY